MTTYTSNDSLFRYTVDNDSNTYTLGDDDYNIIAECFNYWDSIVTPNSGFNGNHIIDVSFNVSTLGEGILGGASVSTLDSLGNQEFGNTFPTKGSIIMNDLHISEMMSDIRNSGKSKYFYVLVHEIGHILGIGTVATWDLSGTPITSYVDTDGETKTYYTGTNALREYKSYLPQIASQLIGIPMEDDGGSGTANVHAEEGHEGATSSNDRYINGVFHPGLDDELMTGWLESSPTSTPLSRISLGFLEDIGYTVDYNLADEYVLSDGSWLDLSANAHCLKSIYIDGTLDISGGDVKLRGTDDNLIVEGDATLQGAVRLGNKVGFGVTNPQYEMDVNGNVYVDTDFTISNDASLNNFTVSGNYSTNAVNYTGGSIEAGDPVYLDTSLDKRLFVRSEDMSFNGVIVNTTTTTEITGNTWNKLGDNIDGMGYGARFGKSVSTNADGTIVAMGGNEYNYNNVSSTGYVQVYQRDESNTIGWSKLGQDIVGQADEQIGMDVSLSSDGTILAVGSYNNLVRVFQYSNSTWTQLGPDIDGEAANDNFGVKISLSGDGSIVAIGARYNNGSDNNRGHVRVYQYREYTDADNGTYHYESRVQDVDQTKPLIITEDGNTAPVVGNSYWIQLGSDIDGENENDESGGSVTISGDGTTVAIGATQNDGTTGTSTDNRGHVRVYQRDETNTTVAPIGWTKLGEDIDALFYSESFGCAVSLNFNGSILAAGANGNRGDTNTWNAKIGNVRIFQYSNSDWLQLGYNIVGENSDDQSGDSVSLNSDGTIVAIGALFNDGNGADSGHVRIYQYREYTDADNGIYEYSTREQGTTNFKQLIATEDINTPPVIGNSYWTQLGFDISGEAGSDRSGRSVSLNDAGTIVAIGSTRHSNLGHVRVYQIDATIPQQTTTYQTIASDVDNTGTFSADISLNNTSTGLTLTNNITIVDTSNNNYGAYTTYANAAGTTYFNVGKSASNVFNIVDNNNTGVYMASDSNSFTSTSDIQLKKDISPLSDSTESLMKLKPCTYKWKSQSDEDTKKHIGFIAQEVEEVLPNLVNENTYPDGSTYKGVAMADLVPYLVSMNNSLDARIKNLKEKINALKTA
jgi:hypothetical protein